MAIISKIAVLLWVTSDGGSLYNKPQFHLIDGFARSSRTDFNKVIFLFLALERDTSNGERWLEKCFHPIFRVLEEILSQSADDLKPKYVDNHGLPAGNCPSHRSH